ncbi:hypothetical protein ACFL1H_03620 [Nanoarchaeota archaeon]
MRDLIIIAYNIGGKELDQVNHQLLVSDIHAKFFLFTTDIDEARGLLDKGTIDLLITGYPFSKASEADNAINLMRDYSNIPSIFIDYATHAGISRMAKPYSKSNIYHDEIGRHLIDTIKNLVNS